MSLLSVLYWLVLILSIVGVWGPASWYGAAPGPVRSYGWRMIGTGWVILFIFIGIRAFKLPLN